MRDFTSGAASAAPFLFFSVRTPTTSLQFGSSTTYPLRAPWLPVLTQPADHRPMQKTEPVLHFAAFTEDPGAPWRRGTLPATARNIANASLDLFALLYETQFNCADEQRARHLAQITDAQIHAWDEALLQLGARAERRDLAALRRRLLTRPAGMTGVMGHEDILAQLHQNERLVTKLQYRIDLGRLEQRLLDFLPAWAAGHAPWPPSAAGTADAPPASHPEPQSFHCVSACGNRHIFLLRDIEQTRQLLDCWLAARPQSVCFAAAARAPVGSFAAIRAWREANGHSVWGSLGSAIAGELLPESEPPQYLKKHWLFPGELTQQAMLDRIAADFRWALLKWNGIAKDEVIAWISDDAELAQAFEILLQGQPAIRLVSSYRNIGDLRGLAGGIQFGEPGRFGEAALVAAAADGATPWLIAEFSNYSGHWWRDAAAKLPSRASRRASFYGGGTLYVAYRAEDEAAFLQLWTHLSCDDNVAFAAVSGRLDPEATLDSIVRHNAFIGVDLLREVAGTDGWMYAHVWGGGAGEHYAIFFSPDAELTLQVDDFARQIAPDHWRIVGHW